MLYIINLVIAHVFFLFLAMNLYYSLPPDMFGPSESNIFWAYGLYPFLTFVIVLRARTWLVLIGALVAVWSGPVINALYQWGIMSFFGLIVSIGVFSLLPVPKDQQNT